MPSSRRLIASNTLTSSAASVTFSSIPSTYTDLALKMSIRASNAGTTQQVWVRFNSDTASNYSITVVRGSGSVAGSTNESSQTRLRLLSGATGNSGTSNTFSNNEIYIPSYTASQNKPMSQAIATENNSTAQFDTWISAQASLYQSTSAITSITLLMDTGGSDQFVSGSSFFLYGISNT